MLPPKAIFNPTPASAILILSASISPTFVILPLATSNEVTEAAAAVPPPITTLSSVPPLISAVCALIEPVSEPVIVPLAVSYTHLTLPTKRIV